MRKSDIIKLDLMKFLRFEKQFPCVCSEGVNNADISAIKNNKMVEIEIKISKSDFKNEKKHKEWKHDKYKNITKVDAEWMKVPNRFYFCVPQDMEEWELKEMETINFKYGLIIWQEGYIYIRRKAISLHTVDVNDFTLFDFCKRNTSELINLKIDLVNTQRELEATKKGILYAEGIA